MYHKCGYHQIKKKSFVKKQETDVGKQKSCVGKNLKTKCNSHPFGVEFKATRCCYKIVNQVLNVLLNIKIKQCWFIYADIYCRKPQLL